MGLLFLLGLIVLILGAIAIGLSFFIKKSQPNEPNDRRTIRWSGVGAALFAVFLFFIASFTIVSTKNVGIVTSFGKTSGELSNGLHFVAPWEQVSEMDAAIQTDNHTNSAGGTGCLDVRIANQQTACVDVSIRWRIHPKKADELYQNYHTFAAVQDSLVTRELTAAVNNQFATYNPLNSIQYGTPAQGFAPNLPYATIAKNVTAQMRKEIGSQIEVLNTIIPYVSFDPETQTKLNELQQQIAQTRVNEQEILSNKSQAAANRALAASVNKSPNVLVAECLNTLNYAVTHGEAVPVGGFNCWGNASSVGVIVQPKG